MVVGVDDGGGGGYHGGGEGVGSGCFMMVELGIAVIVVC